MHIYKLCKGNNRFDLIVQESNACQTPIAFMQTLNKKSSN